MSKIKEAYEKIYKGYGKPNTGDLPKVVSEDVNDIFFWGHMRLCRSHGKKLPKKIRRKINPEEWALLKRDLEMLVHQARYALAYIEEMKDI